MSGWLPSDTHRCLARQKIKRDTLRFGLARLAPAGHRWQNSSANFAWCYPPDTSPSPCPPLPAIPPPAPPLACLCRDTSDASAALQLDGIPFRGVTLKIKRPRDYVHPFGVSASIVSRASSALSV